MGTDRAWCCGTVRPGSMRSGSYTTHTDSQNVMYPQRLYAAGSASAMFRIYPARLSASNQIVTGIEGVLARHGVGVPVVLGVLGHEREVLAQLHAVADHPAALPRLPQRRQGQRYQSSPIRATSSTSVNPAR